MTVINPNQKVDHKLDSELKRDVKTSNVGTVIGVGLVGAVILISYITLYALYLARV